MKASKLILQLVFSLMVAIGLNQVYAAPVVPSAVAVWASGNVMGFVAQSISNGVSQNKAFLNDVNKEIWTNLIVENLFKNNQFLQYAVNADGYVMNGGIVHIPKAGTKPGSQKNRQTLPAPVTRRTDIDILYALNEFTTDPTLIENADKVELSYDKMMSVIGDHLAKLNEDVAEDMIYNWLRSVGGQEVTNAQVVRTTGNGAAAYLDGATGNRKLYTEEDFRSAKTRMNKASIPKQGRYALLDSDALQQLEDDLKTNYDLAYAREVIGNGVDGKPLHGFTILERASAGRYNNAGTPLPILPGTEGAATDNAAAICWQQNSVERAVGTVDFFERLDDPTYYGDLYSGLLRAGGRIRRSEGVVAIVQDTV